MVWYEVKKVFGRASGRAALVVLLGLIVFTCYFAMETIWVDENGVTQKGRVAVTQLKKAQKAWAGPLDEQTIRRVIEENLRIVSTPEYLSGDVRQNEIAYGWGQGIRPIRDLLNVSYTDDMQHYDYYLANRLDPGMAGDFYANRTRLLKEWLAEGGSGAGQFSEAEKDYLIRKYEALETPVYYDYMEGWNQALNYFSTLCMILAMILGFLTAGIFANEFQWKSDAIFFSSAYGRDRAVAAKLKAGWLIVTGIYFASSILYSLIILGWYGFDGAACPLQASRAGWKCFYNLTNGQLYVLTVLAGYLGCLFLSLLTMFVAAKSRSAVVAVMMPVLLVFLPSFVGNLDVRFVQKILSLLPDRLLQLNMAVRYFDLFTIGGKVVGAVPLLAALYAALTFLLFPAVYADYRRKEIL